MKDTRRPRFEAKAKNKRGELYIYDVIGESWGYGISAKMVADALKGMGDVESIDVRINSEGGSVFDGLAMYRLLVDHASTVTVHIDGIAASAASLVAMAGNEIRIAEAGFVMIHNPWTFAAGSSSDLRQVADLMDKLAEQIVGVYAGRTKQSAPDIEQWMDEETWMIAEEAVERGFADTVTENLRAAAYIDVARFRNVPEELLQDRPSAVSAEALKAKFDAIIAKNAQRRLHLRSQ